MKRHQAGFTLIELMLSLVIGLNTGGNLQLDLVICHRSKKLHVTAGNCRYSG